MSLGSEQNPIKIPDGECVICFMQKDSGQMPSISDILKGRQEPWDDTCKIHLQVLKDMKEIFG